MTPDQLANLRALAEAATPGTWRTSSANSVEAGERVVVCTVDTRGLCMVVTDHRHGAPVVEAECDSAYLAAVSPDVVLALLDALADDRVCPCGASPNVVGWAPGCPECGRVWPERLTTPKRLAARVLELEAPGECQSLHKLRAERDAARAKLREMEAWLGEPRLADVEAERDSLRADLIRCRCQRDGTMDVLRQAQIEAGEDGKPIGVTALRAERDELAAEVSAYQGRPEGALPGWAPAREGMSALYERVKPGSGWFALVTPARRQYTWYISGDDGHTEGGHADSPLAAMRASEAAARSRGWL